MLTEYQERINEASEELCLNNPDLLSDRKLLLETARQRVDESGYQSIKGKSRSKRLNPIDWSRSPKRKKISKEYRINRIDELKERINDLTDQIGFREKWQECASNMKNYKECDKLTEQLSGLKSDRRQLQTELAELTKKEKKSQWYFSQKEQHHSPLVVTSPEPVDDSPFLSCTTRVMTSPTPSTSSSCFTIPSPRNVKLLPPSTPTDSESLSSEGTEFNCSSTL